MDTILMCAIVVTPVFMDKVHYQVTILLTNLVAEMASHRSATLI